jgi:putative NADH-flavin reductase
LCNEILPEEITMKIALYGAGGTIGRRILAEALERGHEVTAIQRDPSRLDVTHPRLAKRAGNVLDPVSVAGDVAGHDAVVSAVGPGRGGDPALVVGSARALLDGLRRAGINRLVVVGGAGSLEVAPGVELVDTPQFPAFLRPIGLAHREALQIYRGTTELGWTVLCPPGTIAPGERLGRYRTGMDQLLADEAGQSRISAEDYAIALLDELERPQFVGRRFTVAY